MQSGYLDSMSHKQQLRRDMAAGKDVLTYAVISRGKLKQYTYDVVADEVLTTPIGPLDTRLIQRTAMMVQLLLKFGWPKIGVLL